MPAWYLGQAPDAAASGLDPFRHYLLIGSGRRLSPSRWFDAAHYADRRGGALAEGRDALVDYLRSGAWTVAEPAPGFATAAYLAAYPELVARGLTPLEHWAQRRATDRDASDRLKRSG
jgi:hypothetical protein